ncbi:MULTISPECIES: helix-turn-helix domain-containing protein [Chryseobacterium]|uniref:helix-turn-helix domain-containing protein n=1 Tax=Chryseobacterium TaxID=59732 RepID=UPI001BE96635|nr:MULTISPECIES: AraC family transcriptional regulator [Chryseobacterium]MBT2620773.1 helix-turn-helix transcriptional regulator [Chryseobacterium sp. ISL-6]
MEELKRRFIYQYFILMSSIVLLEIGIRFFIDDTVMALYNIGGLIFLSYGYLMMRERYLADKMVHAYLIILPLYLFFSMLVHWESTVVTFAWLFPLPLMAYIFFSKKVAIAYSVYIIANILASFVVYYYFNFQFRDYSRGEIIILDTIAFVSNFTFIMMLLIYNNEINKLEFLLEIQEQELGRNRIKVQKVTVLEKIERKDDMINEEIAEQLERCMRDEELFKNSNLTISIVSTHLNVNYTYISKIIRYKGYKNFNSYLNTFRVNYVKNLINESDLQKVTLMYIYTEAGFSNQATFNRVFKQIEGITPSEYVIQSLEKKRVKSRSF